MVTKIDRNRIETYKVDLKVCDAEALSELVYSYTDTLDILIRESNDPEERENFKALWASTIKLASALASNPA